MASNPSLVQYKLGGTVKDPSNILSILGEALNGKPAENKITRDDVSFYWNVIPTAFPEMNIIGESRISAELNPVTIAKLHSLLTTDYKLSLHGNTLLPLVIESGFYENVYLKYVVEKAFKEIISLNNESNITPLVKWIINDWGEIKGWRPDSDSGAETLRRILNVIQQPTGTQARIAFLTSMSSASKVFSFFSPEEMFVYDARMVYALNWLTLKYVAGQKTLFPFAGESGNGLINKSQPIINVFLKFHNQFQGEISVLSHQKAYMKYCSLIKRLHDFCFEPWTVSVNGIRRTPVFEAEMLLFALVRFIYQDINRTVQFFASEDGLGFKLVPALIQRGLKP